MKSVIGFVVLTSMSTCAFGTTPCEDLKASIASKLDAKHVAGYSLDVVPKDQASEGKVVGTCDGGTQKIIYTKKK